MAAYTIIFSPTGGVKKVAGVLAEAFAPFSEIDLSEKGGSFDISLSPEDICVIAMPVFGGRLPVIAVERLRKIKANGAAAIIAAVYGNRAFEDALLELKNEAESCGFYVAAAIAANAGHSIMRQYGAGRPDADDTAQLQAFAAEAKKKLAAGSRDPFSVHGNFPYKPLGTIALKPQAGERCIKCGLCAEKCPVGAIPAQSPDKTDLDICIGCMRCVSVCPASARAVDGEKLAAVSEKMKPLFEKRKPNDLFI